MHRALQAQARRVAERAVADLDADERRQLAALLRKVGTSLEGAA